MTRWELRAGDQPVMTTPLLTRDLALQFSACLCDDGFTPFLDDVGLFDHPLVCESVFLSANGPVPNFFREVFSETENLGF